VLDSFRSEFPGVARALGAVHSPPIARTSIAWAFVAAAGASLVVAAVVELLVLAIAPLLFPPTREQPVLIPLRELWEAAGEIAAGAVAIRAGGIAAFALYVSFQLVLLLSSLPGVLLFCSRSPLGGQSDLRICSYADLVADRWPMWLALAIGLVAAALLRTSADGSNRFLRAAGLASISISVGGAVGALLQYAIRPQAGPVPGDAATFALVGGPFWVGWLIGAALAGLVLSRATNAAAVLLAVLLVAPSLAFGVPLARGQVGSPPVQPFLFLLAQWAWLWLPLGACIVLFVVRALTRRNRLVRAM